MHSMTTGLALGGLVPFSTGDFPGRLSAVLFTQGCPLRCRYCHNPHLWPRVHEGAVSWAGAMDWLKRRRGLLDAVVVSGGEPTIQAPLGSALQQIRALGFATGLHTAGVHPQRLAAVLKYVDWVGLDIKAPFGRYDLVAGSTASGERARRALDIVVASGAAFEIRTTLHTALLSEADMLAIAGELQERGIAQWTLQIVRPQGCTDPALHTPARPAWLETLMPSLTELVPGIIVR
jgi:pyruvate formate lyase activating enzyme